MADRLGRRRQCRKLVRGWELNDLATAPAVGGRRARRSSRRSPRCTGALAPTEQNAPPESARAESGTSWSSGFGGVASDSLNRRLRPVGQCCRSRDHRAASTPSPTASSTSTSASAPVPGLADVVVQRSATPAPRSSPPTPTACPPPLLGLRLLRHRVSHRHTAGHQPTKYDILSYMLSTGHPVAGCGRQRARRRPTDIESKQLRKDRLESPSS